MATFDEVRAFWLGVGIGIFLVIFVAILWAMKNDDNNEQF